MAALQQTKRFMGYFGWHYYFSAVAGLILDGKRAVRIFGNEDAGLFV